ncbi:MAG: hypothetical protein WBX11_11970 [Thiobacillaceae bacterium]
MNTSLRRASIAGLFFYVMGGLFVSLPAKADDYRLDPAPKEMIDWNWEKYPVAQDKEVCSLYLKNLRYFARRNEPLSCGQPIAPMLKDKIKTAEWENLDPEKYRNLAKDIVKLAEFKQADPSEKEAVETVRNFKERSGFVFRRLKFFLRGSPGVEEGSNHPLPEQEYNVIQYGNDATNPDNPLWPDRCRPSVGRGTNSDGARLYIADKDMNHVFGEILDWRGRYLQDLWLINNRIYGESYDEKGDVKLTQLRLNYPVWFEPICLYHFKKSQKNTLKE